MSNFLCPAQHITGHFGIGNSWQSLALAQWYSQQKSTANKLP